MSATPSTLAFIKFIPRSVPLASEDLPVERPISRTLLVDTAPDREDTLKSHATTVEQLRQSLKLRSMSPQTQWLYHSVGCDSAQAVTNSESVVRASTWLDASSPAHDEARNTPGGAKLNSRPASSGSENSTQGTIASPTAEQRLVRDPGNDSLKAWILKSTTSDGLLVSPRPLGPTHILVAFPSQDPLAGSSISVPARALEFPINDLLFVLNAPNLSRSPKLPTRLYQELPRVGVRVPDVETFRHLVIYLHTRNLGQLIRAIIPDWIRDIVYPLTALPAFAMAVSDAKEKRKRGLFGILNDVGLTCSCMNDVAFEPQEKQPRPENLVDAVAQELAEASREKNRSDLIKYTAALDAMRANLGLIGYYEQSLWSELDLYRDTLIRAISLESKVGQREWST
ncbi:uncharacterized protein EV420DRAFT_1267535 [Desarmillaria tabescens]|uniref:Uncharacterized protein n=1 Tax=Armillaria tabescens TaxID=1929756 RepID=A0AA39TV65_ARMTA|nr:uncharacterized protein EV420DRAFT_1267535 [Desarmillaria tabescens]KAK0460605.1 hypothetical protein EV420DRAFT_1267535 [Desarmillaria tabescens]